MLRWRESIQVSQSGTIDLTDRLIVVLQLVCIEQRDENKKV